ncbi:MAG: MSCRAMM family protein, partial [Planctomycetota bacterium]
MNAKLLIPLSSALFLGIGVFIGFIAFHKAPSDELVIDSKPFSEEKGGLPPREAPPHAPSEPSTDKLVEQLRAENAELSAKLESMKAGGKEGPAPKRETIETGGPGRAGAAVPARPKAPVIPVDRHSKVNPAELEDGKGGIEGYFINPDDSPGKGITVVLMKQSGEFKHFTDRTDASGHFKRMNLSPGRYQVSSGIMPKTRCKWPAKYIEVTAGEVTRIDMGSTENISVKGRASTADGQPASSAFVLLMHFELGMGSDMYSYSAMTDDEGRFSFANLKPATYQWNLQGMDRVSYGSGRIEFTRAGPFEWDLRPTGLKLSGRVTDRESGKPVGDATVSMRRKGDELSTGSHATTDSEGRFLFQGL